MFDNTIPLDILDVQRDFTRINQDNYGSEYRHISDDMSATLKIRHNEERPKTGESFSRHNMLMECSYVDGDGKEHYVTTSVTVRLSKGTSHPFATSVQKALSYYAGGVSGRLLIGEN